MALQEQVKKGSAPQTQGPTQQADGLPSNPSDEIFKGRALPIRQPQATVVRRPFVDSLVTRNPLHYDEGRGTDEADGACRMNEKSEPYGS